jgi:anti-sigma-K factor RskA
VRCDHEHDDGAYVLGALSPAERAAYERHLATCSFCREAVADIAVLPGLLGRLEPADFQRLLEPEPVPRPVARNRTPDLVMAAQSTRRLEQRRARRRIFASALAATCLALLAGVAAVTWMGRGGAGPAAGPAVSMQAVNGAVPVSATVNLTSATGGTRVNLVCFYNRDSADSKSYTVRLMAIGPDNETEQVGSWVALPGREFKMQAVTHFPAGNLARLELVRNDGRTLLAYDVP